MINICSQNMDRHFDRGASDNNDDDWHVISAFDNGTALFSLNSSRIRRLHSDITTICGTIFEGTAASSALATWRGPAGLFSSAASGRASKQECVYSTRINTQITHVTVGRNSNSTNFPLLYNSLIDLPHRGDWAQLNNLTEPFRRFIPLHCTVSTKKKIEQFHRLLNSMGQEGTTLRSLRMKFDSKMWIYYIGQRQFELSTRTYPQFVQCSPHVFLFFCVNSTRADVKVSISCDITIHRE